MSQVAPPTPFLDAFDRRVEREKLLGRVWTACKIRLPLPSSNHSHHCCHPWALWTHLLLNTHPVVREHPTHTPTHREDVVTRGGAARLPQLSLEVRKCGPEHWLSACCPTLCQLPLCLQVPHFTQPLQGGCATNSRGPPQMGSVASVGQGRGLDSGPHRADSFLCTFLEAQSSQLFRFTGTYREHLPYKGRSAPSFPDGSSLNPHNNPVSGC